MAPAAQQEPEGGIFSAYRFPPSPPSESFSIIDAMSAPSDTGASMARYSAFLGRRVEVQYRAGDILLPATGTFAADSGRSIFLEEHFEQRGHEKQFRWEIPYQYIVRIQELDADGASPNRAAAPAEPASASYPPPQPTPTEDPRNSSTAAAGASGAASSLLPFSHRPQTR